MDGLQVAATSLFCGEENMNFICAACVYETEVNEELMDYNLQLLYDSSDNSTVLELRARASAYIRNLKSDSALLKKIDMLTAAQSDSKWWNIFRSGRITASNMKDVCSTQVGRPSLSLIKKICYPNEQKFSAAATKYGKIHEEKAVDQLFQSVQHLHKNLQKTQAGLVIYDEYPVLGASPDAIFTCDCHGVITVEVKCPYSARNRTDMIEILLQLKDSFIERNQHYAQNKT